MIDKTVLVLFSLFFVYNIGHGQELSNVDILISKIFNTSSGPLDQGPNPTINPVPGKLNPNVETNPQPNIEPNIDTDGAQKYKSCGSNKECVPRWLCNNSIITTGETIIDIRINDETSCDYLEVCCDVLEKSVNPVVIPTPKEHEDKCGYQNPDGVGFKISGNTQNEAEFGEFPWMVAILREEESNNEIFNLYECGGAIIAPNVIITAAHCVKNREANKLLVRAGEWDTQTNLEVIPHQDQAVKEIIVHPNFHKGALFNDIALLILEQPFTWAENVRPICLPESNIKFDYSRCYATGWGKDKFGREGTYQQILKKIDLPIIPNEQCQRQLRKTRLGLYFQLHESFICAGGEQDKDTCKGDGGSPLACPIPGEKNRFYHAGIVAWGIGCNEVNVPGVYANIPYLRSWIDNTLANKRVNSQAYVRN